LGLFQCQCLHLAAILQYNDITKASASLSAANKPHPQSLLHDFNHISFELRELDSNSNFVFPFQQLLSSPFHESITHTPQSPLALHMSLLNSRFSIPHSGFSRFSLLASCFSEAPLEPNYQKKCIQFNSMLQTEIVIGIEVRQLPFAFLGQRRRRRRLSVQVNLCAQT